MIKSKNLCKSLASGLLLLAASSAYAIPTTYTFSITGSVLTLGTKVVLKDYTKASTTDITTTTYLPSLFGFPISPTSGQTITATGTFTAEFSPSFTGSVLFNAAATGNSLTITGGSTPTVLYASDDTGYLTGTAGPVLTFSSGQLTGFDYQKLTTSTFNSLYMNFDDMTSVAKTQTGSGGTGQNTWTEYTTYNALLGQWGANANLVATPVPEASAYAMMLAGLGLVGFMAARRKSL